MTESIAVSARDIIKQAFESEFDDACSGDAFADKCVTILHEEGFTVLAPRELDGETLEAAATVADKRAATAWILSHEAARALLEALPDAIRALKASPDETDGEAKQE
ncbi:hypothetical protein GN330_22970 [Nitratireductor sp. CAU 1489]|uniref:Uncharacterized protein n=1 Tax=Nitratireductor arenosus TaxID=2682096 RepID=A0A844QKF2_9HYPH|nr:hypothetical protein [Nitratireductor arenosus]MVB00113.1 hypothetical protein [Nitratireductor arenosus]